MSHNRDEQSYAAQHTAPVHRLGCLAENVTRHAIGHTAQGAVVEAAADSMLPVRSHRHDRVGAAFELYGCGCLTRTEKKNHEEC